MGRSQTNPMGADPRFRQMGQAPQPPQFGQDQPPQVQAGARMANPLNAFPTMARPPQSNGMQMGAFGQDQVPLASPGFRTAGPMERDPWQAYGINRPNFDRDIPPFAGGIGRPNSDIGAPPFVDQGRPVNFDQRRLWNRGRG